jgi:hypothetical protein
MFDTYKTAKGYNTQKHLVAGAWKFGEKTNSAHFGVEMSELVATAQELVNSGIAKGGFIHVFVRGTGKHELGICFMYEPTLDERAKTFAELRKPYIDFFRRRHGAAFKGWDICTGIDVIELTN